MKIRTATPMDAESLLNIYRPYVLNTAVTFEYEVPTAEAFAERIRSTLERYPYFVAEVDGQPIGYAYASALKSRPAYGWAIETSIYIAQDQHRMGAGRALYHVLEEALFEMGVTNAYACITAVRGEDPRVNDDSIRFHTSMGYQPAGRWNNCGYKFNRWYDVCWMEKILVPHMQDQPPLRPFLQTAWAHLSKEIPS